MTFMSSNQIREAFLGFFERQQHQRIASSSLVPANDPTLLFTNAGMVQFKDCFLGTDQRSYIRAASSQRCVRAGGKHNDLENVGYTARHHTFFEMLGNFSFGDYFKEEAIKFAWEFLTQELKLPAEKLWVTVYQDDKEAEDIWFNKMGIDQRRFSRLGEKDNFWSMGDTGPCGPCSEIFYDHGADVPGGPPGSPDEDGDRYIEIWNLVFMQFNRDKSGKMTPLPKPSVDTGMGLERIAAVMQKVHSNYEIDLFAGLIKSVAKVLGVEDLSLKSLRVIADHIRACSFLIVDGVIPSNEKRGYVLRRIMRRAIRHGHKLGATESFFHKLVKPLADLMGDAYPELVSQCSEIEKTIEREEIQFARTLDKGMKILERDLENLTGDTVGGKTLFTLYDTFGFPLDLTADIARERNLSIDEEGFNKLMEKQKDSSKPDEGPEYEGSLSVDAVTEFVGYDRLTSSSKAEILIVNGEHVESVVAGESALLVTESTPFYAESGGQVGDRGLVTWSGGSAEVKDTAKAGKAFAHNITMLKGSLKKGELLELRVSDQMRELTAVHHSATHLLHAALRQVLGEHVTQKGSLVDEQKLRFDFSHPDPVSSEQLFQAEALVNQQIRKNYPVSAEVMSMDSAKERGAMALFGEKYGDEVRVLTMGDFSVELCGGTHVNRLGDIGGFKIVHETGIAAGVRRIEAIAGEVAVTYQQQQDALISAMCEQLKATPDNLSDKASQLLVKAKDQEKEIGKMKQKLASSHSGDLLADAKMVAGTQVVVKQVDGIDGKALRDLMDQVKSKMDSGIVLLGVENNGKANLIAGVTKDLTKQIKAGDLVNCAAQLVGGKGGGRPDMAQAGGPQPENLPQAIAAVIPFIEKTFANA